MKWRQIFNLYYFFDLWCHHWHPDLLFRQINRSTRWLYSHLCIIVSMLKITNGIIWNCRFWYNIMKNVIIDFQSCNYKLVLWSFGLDACHWLISIQSSWILSDYCYSMAVIIFDIYTTLCRIYPWMNVYEAIVPCMQWTSYTPFGLGGYTIRVTLLGPCRSVGLLDLCCYKMWPISLLFYTCKRC